MSGVLEWGKRGVWERSFGGTNRFGRVELKESPFLYLRKLFVGFLCLRKFLEKTFVTYPLMVLAGTYVYLTWHDTQDYGGGKCLDTETCDMVIVPSKQSLTWRLAGEEFGFPMMLLNLRLGIIKNFVEFLRI